MGPTGLAKSAGPWVNFIGLPTRSVFGSLFNVAKAKALSTVEPGTSRMAIPLTDPA